MAAMRRVRAAPPEKLTKVLEKRAAHSSAAKCVQPKKLDLAQEAESPVRLIPGPENPRPPLPEAELVPPGFAAELPACDAKGLRAGACCTQQGRSRHCAAKAGLDRDCHRTQDNNRGGG